MVGGSRRAASISGRAGIALLGLALGMATLAACGGGETGDGGASPTIVGTVAPEGSATAASGLQVRTMSVQSAAGSTAIVAEIANTGVQRGVGLMFRQGLPENTGMLFVYGAPPSSGHWMRNTLIALDIAYLDAEGRVIEVLPGQPLDETVQRPKQPYRYVLEMRLGWFAANGHLQDVRVVLPRDLPAGEP